ncbi:hypothetical protein BD560DRAFT_369405 [Blakeslea trispora]|nr:hypothetical protein BD560DRAFT_369405 [Blakeslea trispora]
MAAVSFLETTNLVGLGLSADKVISHVIDFNEGKSEPFKKPIALQSNTANPSGLKLVSDVMDSSYRVFDGLGKFWQRNTHEFESKSSVLVGQVKGRVRKVSDAAAQPFKGGLNELKEMAEKSSILSNHDASSLPSFMEDRKKVKSKDAAPIAKFLEMKSVDELKIGEVTELLADYKRLAAMIKQAGLA